MTTPHNRQTERLTIKLLVDERDSLKKTLQEVREHHLKVLRNEALVAAAAFNYCNSLNQRIADAQVLLYQAIGDGDVGSSQLKEIVDILQGTQPPPGHSSSTPEAPHA